MNCSDDSIKPQLQGSWAKATTYVEEAKTKLDDLRSPDTLPAGGGGETPPADDPAEESPPANDSDEALQECLDKPTFEEQRACARRLLPE